MMNPRSAGPILIRTMILFTLSGCATSDPLLFTKRDPSGKQMTIGIARNRLDHVRAGMIITTQGRNETRKR